MTQLKQMIDRIGVDETRGPLVSAILRAVEWTCRDCRNAGECGAWVATADEDDAYREFCPNAGLLDCLPHRRGPGRI